MLYHVALGRHSKLPGPRRTLEEAGRKRVTRKPSIEAYGQDDVEYKESKELEPWRMSCQTGERRQVSNEKWGDSRILPVLDWSPLYAA